MTRPTRDVSKAILERRSASGLGVACADAQADGVPCDVVHGDCASCQRGAASALAATTPARRPLSRRPRRRR